MSEISDRIDAMIKRGISLATDGEEIKVWPKEKVRYLDILWVEENKAEIIKQIQADESTIWLNKLPEPTSTIVRTPPMQWFVPGPNRWM